MRLTIALLVLINAYFLNARSVPVVEELPRLENPCTTESLYALRFYYAYPSNESRYIECNPWGGMEVRECPEGSSWNVWLSSCIVPTPASELPAAGAENSTLLPVPFCSFYGNYTCQNGGLCNQFFSESRCFCLVNYAGDYCDVSLSGSKGAFGQLINDTFSLDLYKRQRPLVNDSLSFNTSFDTSLILDAQTKQSVQKYMDLYPNGEMRFDTLINYLVQDFLSQLFPSAFFLREFTLESEIQMGYSNAIPNLLQSAKYGFDRFENFYLIFEEVLDSLVDYLPKYMPNVKSEAQTFFEVYDMIFTRFSSMSNSTVEGGKPAPAAEMENRTELTRDEIKRKIYEDFNTTLVYSYDLFRYLNRFDDELSVRGENFTSEEMIYAIGNFSLDTETTRLLSEIHMTSTQMWDSLSFYGFWYVISKYVTVPEIDMKTSVSGGSQRPFFSVDDKKKPVFSALLDDDVSVTPAEGADENDGEDQSAIPESDRLLGAFESTTVLPSVGFLVGESTTVMPKVARLLGESTVAPSVRKLEMESTTVVPKVGQLIGESTTAIPSISKLVWDSTIAPSVARFLPELTTIAPSVRKLEMESTTVLPSIRKLVGESTTVMPKVARLFGESTVVPSVRKLEMESTTVLPSISKLVGESTTAIPSISKLVWDSTIAPSVARFLPELTTIAPSVRKLEMESTTVLPSKLIDESTTPSVARQLSESTTVAPSVRKLEMDSTTAFPSIGKLVGESTTVMPKVARLFGDSTVAPSVRKLEMESTTVLPSVRKLEMESTTVLPSIRKLVGESTTVFPSVSRLSSESTTAIPSIGKLVAESTTVLPSVRKLVVDATTVASIPSRLVAESSSTVRPSF